MSRFSRAAKVLRTLQSAVERRVQSGREEDGLQQSRFLVRTIVWVLLSTTGLSVLWLSIAQTDEVVTAPGKLEPVGDVKTVQMPVGGVLSEILVKDGEQVSKGQILLRLDNEATLERSESLQQVLAAKTKQHELKTLELQRYATLNDTEQSTLSDGLALERQILQKLDILRLTGATSELQYLQQKNKVRELDGQLQRLRVERLRQLAVYQQELQGIVGEQADLRSQIAELSVNIRYQDLRSPVDGVIFDLKPKGTGFVAQSSEPVMKVVPFSALQAKVEIGSADIGFVRVGKPVDLSIDSFPATDFGVLQGTLSSIGSDALPPDQMKQYYRFPAVIKLNSQQFKLRSGLDLPLQVGMSLTANIKLRKVSYLQLLLGTFKDKAESLRRI